jgi:hypothetical protein
MYLVVHRSLIEEGGTSIEAGTQQRFDTSHYVGPASSTLEQTPPTRERQGNEVVP